MSNHYNSTGCLTLKNKICTCTTFNLHSDPAFSWSSEKSWSKQCNFFFLSKQCRSRFVQNARPAEGNLNESFGKGGGGYWRAKHKQILSTAAGHINYIPRAQRSNHVVDLIIGPCGYATIPLDKDLQGQRLFFFFFLSFLLFFNWFDVYAKKQVYTILQIMCESICIFVFWFKYNFFVVVVNLASSTDYYFAFHPRATNGYIETKCQKEKRKKKRRNERVGWNDNDVPKRFWHAKKKTKKICPWK